MRKKIAIDKWITTFQGKTFSDPKDTEMFFRETIPQLVEDIYKEELKIADNRWKAERELNKLNI